jgi:hypothetical protein
VEPPVALLRSVRRSAVTKSIDRDRAAVVVEKLRSQDVVRTLDRGVIGRQHGTPDGVGDRVDELQPGLLVRRFEAQAIVEDLLEVGDPLDLDSADPAALPPEPVKLDETLRGRI